jgi:glucose-6-phosphate 1-epimerase
MCGTKVPDANNPVRKMDENERIFFGKGLVDSVYLDSDPETILDVGTGCSVAVENTQGFSDTVIWNPHETLQPSCWQHFVCVESAQVGAPVVLGPGDEWVGEANLSVFDHPEEE